ncbi:MAG: hypothetical protein DRN06_04160 [Thermoprotei archaeon]|nr:MAG: hypothetical protein DRN06_04160 [Thermoprotei archaeon]
MAAPRPRLERYLKAAELAVEWLKGFWVKDLGPEYYASILPLYRPGAWRFPRRCSTKQLGRLYRVSWSTTTGGGTY